MENNTKTQDRVLARITAADLTEVVGGQPGNTSVVTGPEQQNINGSDITNLDGDHD